MGICAPPPRGADGQLGAIDGNNGNGATNPQENGSEIALAPLAPNPSRALPGLSVEKRARSMCDPPLALALGAERRDPGTPTGSAPVIRTARTPSDSAADAIGLAPVA
jgi:hypothetical protein